MMDMKEQGNRLFTIIQSTFTLSLILIVFVYFALTFYIIPSVDDLYFNAAVRDLGFVNAMLGAYQTFHGRYVTDALLGACGIHWGSIFDLIICERWLGAIFFILFAVALYRFIRSISLRTISSSTTFIYTILFLVMFCLSMPVQSAQFYWLSSVVTHTVGLMLMLFLLAGLLDEMFIKEYKYAWLNYPVVLFLAGTSEPVIATAAVLMVLGLSLRKIVTGQFDFHWIFILICLVLATTVAVLSPGNELRENQNGAIDLNIFYLGFVFRYLVRYSQLLFSKWMLNGTFILSSIYLFLEINNVSGIFAKINFKHVWLGLVVWLFLIYISPLMATLAVHSFNLRYWNVSCFIFLLGWYINLAMLKLALVNRGNLLSWNDKTKAIFMMLIVLFSLGNIRFLFTVNELTNQAPLYSQKMYQRFEKIISSPSDTVVVDGIPFQENAPSLIYYNLGPNPACGYNYHYEKFFNKKSIYVRSSEDQIQISEVFCHSFLKIKGY